MYTEFPTQFQFKPRLKIYGIFSAKGRAPTSLKLMINNFSSKCKGLLNPQELLITNKNL